MSLIPGQAGGSGGGGSGSGLQKLTLAGDTISLNGGGGSVIVGTATSVASATAKLTAQSYDGGLVITSFDSDVVVGSILNPRTTVVNGVLSPTYIQDSTAVNGTSGQVLSIDPSGGLLWTAGLQVVATSATPIALTPTARGKTYILTGTTTQDFSTSGLGVGDAGFFVIVHNGNGVNGGDVNLTATGTLTGTDVIHERTNVRNNGTAYLYWNGTGLVGY